jgi:hypothetical protein
MARRATSALAAVLSCAVLALPAVMLVSHQPAAAATGHLASSAHQGTAARQVGTTTLSITITGMTPQWASPRSTIAVTGTLRNNSKSPVGQLTVQLLGSSTPVASVAELQLDASQPYSPATAPLSGATWQANGALAPGASKDWSIRVPASAIGMTTFGVYPLAAQAQDQSGTQATTTTYVPYEPDKKGGYSASRPAPAKIAWLWPVIDVPLLNKPWQGNCSGPQAAALAQSLGQSGRLGELARAGAADPDITWIIDPAVLTNVQALTTCQGAQPRWAKAASTWLTAFKNETSGRPLTATPYGNPNVAALIAAGRGGDVKTSFQLGRTLASGILSRDDLNPQAAGGATSATPPVAQAAGIAWSAVGVPSYGTLESLVNADHVGTLVLSTSAFPYGQSSVLKTLDGGGSYVTALLASQSLTRLLGSSSGAPGSAFATGQQFLAETALLSQQVPAQPIVVAPPPRWAPPAALAAGVLADTGSAPWLRQVSLTSLASARHIQTVPTQNWPAGSVGPSRVTRPELRKFRLLDRQIAQLEAIRARPDPYLFLAVSTLQSSAFQGTSRATTDALIATVLGRIYSEQQAVRIVAEKRITLGGLKGSVPVSIENLLGYPVKVALQLQYNQASGIKIASDPLGLVTVPAHQTQTIRLRVQAAAVGSTTVTMMLANQGGVPFTVPQRMTVQATQVGILGMIIFAAALGVFLIASAARAVRRGRPGTGADQATGNAPTGDHDRAGSADPAEADTVMAKHTELGAVGKRGP